MKPFFRLADNERGSSLAVKMRRNRFQLFKNLIDVLPRPLTILDVGGTEAFWKTMDFTNESGVKIMLLNVSKVETRCVNFISIKVCSRKRFYLKKRYLAQLNLLLFIMAGQVLNEIDLHISSPPISKAQNNYTASHLRPAKNRRSEIPGRNRPTSNPNSDLPPFIVPVPQLESIPKNCTLLSLM